jgi:signal transduction histidine kinase
MISGDMILGEGAMVKADDPVVQADSPHAADEAFAAPAADRSRSDRKTAAFPLVTTRVGMIFLASSVCTLGYALSAQGSSASSRFGALMWFAAVATSSLGGLVSIRSVRTLRTIEAELRRNRDGRARWPMPRPIIGSDPITRGWNELIDDIRNARRDAARSRTPAPLDQEVITLARAMRGLPVAWVITDVEGRIRFLAPAACAVLALDDDEAHVGKDLPELLGLRDQEDETAAAALSRLLGSVRMVTERRSLRIGDRVAFLRVTRSRLTGRTGDGQGLAWVLSDETQQRLTTEARDKFVMTATHELRTPLTNLQGYAEALQEQEGLEIEQQKEFCNVITSEANRLGRLVDQLLTVSQMEAGSMTINRHELEMIPMLEYAVDQVQGQAEQKQIDLKTSLPAKLPIILGDRDKLQAALVNLLGNAVKYTPPGGEVMLRCAAEDRHIHVDVEDNGPGIPEDERAKVFEKFFRGSAFRDSDQRGNGLGLAFAREIARLHGGDIELQSVIGEGSTFTLTLPIAGQSRSGI